MLLRFQRAAVRGNYETGNQAFSMRLRFLTIGGQRLPVFRLRSDVLANKESPSTRSAISVPHGCWLMIRTEFSVGTGPAEIPIAGE